jgi:hypothetical protein
MSLRCERLVRLGALKLGKSQLSLLRLYVSVARNFLIKFHSQSLHIEHLGDAKLLFL